MKYLIAFFSLLPFYSFSLNNYELDTVQGIFLYEIGPDVITIKGNDGPIPRENCLIKSPKYRKYKKGVFYFFNPYSGLLMNEYQSVLIEINNDFLTEELFKQNYSDVLNSKKSMKKRAGYSIIRLKAKLIVVKLKRKSFYFQLYSKFSKKWVKEISTDQFLIFKILELT